MNLCRPARGPSHEWRILCCAALLAFISVPVHSQDVAEAARQEKARKAAEQASRQNPSHVYTDEDLKRSVILTPEDQARVVARKQKQTPAPAEQNAEQLPSNMDPQAESLGEIARRLRQDEAAREAELAEKRKFTPFPYEVPADALAEPKAGFDLVTIPSLPAPPVAPPAIPAHRLVVRPATPPSSSAARGRISPFEPRPLTGLARTPPRALVVIPGLPARTPEPPRASHKVLSASPEPAAATASLSDTGLRQVEVERGQSWWKLAQIYLGGGARWPELRKLNANVSASSDILPLGRKILVPETATKTHRAATITVKKGDTLWSLAQQQFGQGGAWVCLARVNPQIRNYARIPVGTQLHLEAASACRARGLRPLGR